MHRFLMVAWIGLGSMALLTACGSTPGAGRTEAASVRVVPSEALRHGMPEAQSLYMQGKARLGAGDPEGARSAFGRAVALDARFVDAHNGMAIALAQVGELQPAAERLLSAIAISPDAAYLHANLGLIRSAQGRHADAVTAFEAALRTDPAHPIAVVRIVDARRQAAESTSTVSAAPVGMTARTTPPATMPAPHSGAVVSLGFGPMSEPVVPVGAAASPPRDRAPEARPSPVTRSPYVALRVEVANGHGVRGGASRASERLRAADVNVVRVSNASRFDHVRTRLIHGPEHREQAMQLARLLPIEVELVEAPPAARGRSPGGDLRLVLGRDMTAPARIERVGRVDPSTSRLAAR